MHAVDIGPFVFAPDRLAAIVAIGVFLLAASIAARHLDGRLERWAGAAVLGGLLAARAGHVALNWAHFSDEPWRVLAIWQGGFSLPAAAIGVAIVSAFQAITPRLLAGAVIALALGGFAGLIVVELTKATLGQSAPISRMNTLDGGFRSIQEFRGKPVVVNLWASWCPPCRREMPLLARRAEERSDVTFLFVNQGESATTIARYLEKDKLRLDNVLLDMAMATPRHYGTPGLPVTLFLRADGTLASLVVGEISSEALDAGIRGITEGAQ